MSEEQAIRELISTWMSASQAGDTETVLGLMTDDVVFMTPGREPFGREAFAAAQAGQSSARMEGSAEVRELRVLGDWAYARTFIRVSMTPAAGEPVARSGYTLSIFAKGADGRWRLARDANLLTPEA